MPEEKQQKPEAVRLIHLADKAIEAWPEEQGEAEVTNELDELVIDAALKKAKEINEKGIEAQVVWLVDAGLTTDTERLLAKLAKGPRPDGTAHEDAFDSDDIQDW